MSLQVHGAITKSTFYTQEKNLQDTCDFLSWFRTYTMLQNTSVPCVEAIHEQMGVILCFCDTFPLFDTITDLLSSQQFGTNHVRQRGTAKLHLKWLNCKQNKSLAHFQTHAEVLYPTVVTQHCINFSHPMSINTDQVGLPCTKLLV